MAKGTGALLNEKRGFIGISQSRCISANGPVRLLLVHLFSYALLQVRRRLLALSPLNVERLHLAGKLLLPTVRWEKESPAGA